MPQNFTSIDYLLKPAQQISSGSSKESAPTLTRHPENFHIQEVVEHKINDEEVQGHVLERKESIDVPPDLQAIGVQPVSQPTFPTYQSVSLPLSDDKVYAGLHAPINSSLRWLSEVCAYILRHTHLYLKQVRGKIVRVKK